LRGFAASAGVAIAPARLLGGEIGIRHHARVDPGAVPAEVSRFNKALERSKAGIEIAKAELNSRHGATYASILDVYLLMHDDAVLVDAVTRTIRDDEINAEWALAKVAERLRAPLLEDSSSYFRERARDIDHLEEHLLRELRGGSTVASTALGPSVLVAQDLTPADAVRMLAPPTVALVTAGGAPSSHTSILARAFGVPTVVGVGARLAELAEGEDVLVDGFSGEVSVGFGENERREAEGRQVRFLSFLGDAPSDGPTATEDDVEIRVAANVGLPSEVETALESGAQGIGLYRTELMCLDRSEPPSEDEQVQVYEEVARAMAPDPVVIRTFDWRLDKRLRANEVGASERDWLKTQIRAVLRASLAGELGLMFPMVATVKQFQVRRALVDEVRAELGSSIGKDIPIGMMVEVPSAALLADRFAAVADFFAVGTNDLAHYTLASARGMSGADASPLDPSVLRLLSTVTAAADRAGIPCSLCGDVATSPTALGLMAGLGFRSVSVPVTAVPLARAVIRRIDLAMATQVAKDALACETSDEVSALIEERLGPRLDPLWTPTEDA
jgi:phosphotransferase system enzyme I (PtsI)